MTERTAILLTSSNLRSQFVERKVICLIAAIFSVVESCRRLGLPIRRYLGDILPGLANRSIQTLAGLTSTAYTAKQTK
jgi:hypothetical protein